MEENINYLTKKPYLITPFLHLALCVPNDIVVYEMDVLQILREWKFIVG